MTADDRLRGRFSEGQEALPEDDPEKLREGSFADGQATGDPASEDDEGGFAVGQAGSADADEPPDDLEGDFGRGQRHEDGG